MSKKTVHDADAIINRHIGNMLDDLRALGLDAKAAVACVVGGSGKPSELDTNIAIALVEPVFDVGEDPDAQALELLAFVWATIDDAIRKQKMS